MIGKEIGLGVLDGAAIAFVVDVSVLDIPGEVCCWSTRLASLSVHWLLCDRCCLVRKSLVREQKRLALGLLSDTVVLPRLRKRNWMGKSSSGTGVRIF